jgi:uncharacterized DUF497 family protein
VTGLAFNPLNLRFVRYNIYTMEFEFDPDFVEEPATTSGERRYLVIGKISGKHWSAVITYRGHRIRIISVRRSREEEIKIYEI